MRVSLSSFLPRARRIQNHNHRFQFINRRSLRAIMARSKDIDPLSSSKFDDVSQVTTLVLKVDPLRSLEEQRDLFDVPVKLIQQGEVVAFPTETVYGLGANALDGNAARKIFLTKKRPMDNPLIVHVSSMEMLLTVVDHIPPLAQTLIDSFWPGPLTILFPKKANLPEEVSCGQPTVGVRMPSHPIARKLIELSNRPIAAPSANLSGRPSPTTADHVFDDLKGRCQCIIDGGPTAVGLESTVVDIEKRLILRPGGVTLEQLREVIPEFKVFKPTKENQEMIDKPATPGLKYRHYSPHAEVLLLEGENFEKTIDIAELSRAGKKLGVIHTHSKLFSYPPALVSSPLFFIRSIGDDPKTIAQGLFSVLRELDERGVSVIIMEGISEEDEGLAVMNRIRKAASRVEQL